MTVSISGLEDARVTCPSKSGACRLAKRSRVPIEVAEMDLDELKASGPAMALLLQSLALHQEDFDGLILGTI